MPSDTSLGVIESSAAEWVQILLLVFGGCCSNVWALESILQNYPDSGTLLTFAQFVYVTIQNVKDFIVFPSSGANDPSGKLAGRKWLPRLRKRQVPLKRWSVQVVLFLAVSLLNNYAFSMKIPMTIHIIFRSGGLCVSMMAGYFAGKRYSSGQIAAVVIITVGIILATVSAPARRSSGRHTSSDRVAAQSLTGNLTSATTAQYTIGIAMLTLALVLSAVLGLWQEETYKRYGKAWREGLFYSHLLSLPFFAPLYPSLAATFNSYLVSPPTTLFLLPTTSPQMLYLSLSHSVSGNSIPGRDIGMIDWRKVVLPSAIVALGMNVFTQGMCIKGVNRLTSASPQRVSSTTVNLVLTLRKAVSLGISVWYYGKGLPAGLAIGGGMVFFGTILYALAPPPTSPVSLAPPTRGRAESPSTAADSSAASATQEKSAQQETPPRQSENGQTKRIESQRQPDDVLRRRKA